MEQILSSFLAASAVLLLAVVGAALFLIKKGSGTSNSSSSSAPSPTQPLPAADYEVFLSFRGPDVRTTFADFLYRYLNRSNVRIFIDDEELRKGERIAPALASAISESKIYIPILSQGYASSKWCLQELALMVKYCKQGKGQVILPIFYLVEPREVRHQEGSYKKAFRQHGKKYDAEMIKEWKEALQVVGDMKGWHATESDGQGAVIDQVFSKVWSHLTRNYMLVADDLIGIDIHVEKMKALLQSDYEGVKIIGIHGMGGIGKTTIAKALYNEICAEFDGYCFLEDVRDILLKTDGIVTLQKKVIYGILRLDHEVKDASEGINIIRDRFSKQKVLVIVDDADDRFKFHKIFGKLEDFHPGSRFIITTRDIRVMEFFHHYDLYKPEEMSEDHSLQLFSRHALGMNYPPNEDVALSLKFVKVAAGLPLAIKVIGSLLFRKDKSYWNAKLKQLRDLLPSEVQETLRISYLELTHEEKQIFLDIACLFIGESKDQPFYMWSDCGLHPEIAITTLIQRCLIKIKQNSGVDRFWMHDHVRDLGRTIIREEDLLCPWKRSRIWSNKEALDMLTDEEGTDRLEVLTVHFEGTGFELTNRHLEKLSRLRYLDITGGRVSGNFIRVLPNVRWLRLLGCRSIPVDLNMKKLVTLTLSHCPVTSDWSGWERIKVAHKMKSVSLSACNDLKQVPDLSGCGNLELLDLSRCEEMSGELHIGNFKNLKKLNIFGTKNITKLTGDIGMLQNLQVMIAQYSGLRALPPDFSSLSSLEVLDLRAPKLGTLPPLPTSLKQLFVSCPCVPNLSELKNLETLHFSNCARPEVPEDIGKLSKLKTLCLRCCKNRTLQMEEEEAGKGMAVLFALPSTLNCLEIMHFRSLERLPNLANLKNLSKLSLVDIEVHEIPSLGELTMLETLDIYDVRRVANLDGLEHLVVLKVLLLESCSSLEKLPTLSNLTKLQKLKITSCKLLSEIHGLGELGDSVSYIEISNCPSLAYIQGLESMGLSGSEEPRRSFFSNLGKLKKLVLHLGETNEEHILSPRPFLDLSGLQNLHELSISACKRLIEVKGLEGVRLLRSLRISNCSVLRTLSDLSGLEHLNMLDVSGCTQLTEIIGLEGLESLERLNMSGCTLITTLDLSYLRNMASLDFCGCKELTQLMGLEKLKSLRQLKMANCTLIRKLPDLSCFKLLWKLDISGCVQLTEVTGIVELKERGVTNLRC